MYKLPIYQTIKQRLEEPRKFIQVIMGPRQVGKSTVVRQVLDDLDMPSKFYAADFVPASNHVWISDCWESARLMAKMSGNGFILVIDEIQKIDNWSEIVKKLWDEDTLNGVDLKVVILGSSRLLLKKGLSESLAGRFEEIRMAQWSYPQMQEAFGYDLNQYIFYGGYPGSASFVSQPERFENYIEASIIEASINRDILIDSRVLKPALLRQTFELAAAYSGKILSFTKLMGQLQDAGNTTTLTQYLHLLNQSCLVGALMKYSVDIARTKSSIPKFQVYDNSLKDVYLPYTFEEVTKERHKWGEVFESAVGAYIICQSFLHRVEVFYWREKDLEVDFVLRKKGRLIAIEVKSNKELYTKGLSAFKERFHPYRAIVIGDGGISAEDFFSMSLLDLFA